MSLLSLPDDIFHMVTERVKDVGPEALLPLRATSRLFRDEVNHIIFVKSSVAEVKAGPYTQFVNHNTGLYLFAKLMDPRGRQPELLTLIHKMTGHLCRELNLKADEDRLCCERQLCEGLFQYYEGPFIRRLLWCQEAATDVVKLTEHYKELAALLFGTPSVCDYLRRGRLDQLPTFNKACATPLVYAVASEDIELVDLVTKYYIEPNRRYVMSAWSKVVHMKTALSLAFRLSRADFACKIAQAMKEFIQKYHCGIIVDKTEYLEWLDSAISLADSLCVQALVQLCPAGTPVRDGQFILALRSSSFEVVKTLFDLGKIDVNDTLIKGLPIKIASGAGNIVVLQGLIEAGARVPDSVSIHALKHDKLEVVLHLWRLGYPVPAMDKWPRKCSQTVYDTLCMMKIAEGTKRQSLPDYDKFKDMSSQALRDISPPSAESVARRGKRKGWARPWSWLNDRDSEETHL